MQSEFRKGLHVAIIMDGNGRWATRRGLPRVAGHRAGVAAARRVVEHAPDIGIRYLTLYAFSSDNWRRPAAEVQRIFWLLRAFLRLETERMRENGARLQVIGRSRGRPDGRELSTIWPASRMKRREWRNHKEAHGYRRVESMEPHPRVIHSARPELDGRHCRRGPALVGKMSSPRGFRSAGVALSRWIGSSPPGRGPEQSTGGVPNDSVFALRSAPHLLVHRGARLP